jgi:SAM-dependent methyltransferase
MTDFMQVLYRRYLDCVLAERRIVRQFIAAHLPATTARLGLDLGAGSSPYRRALQQALPALQLIASDRHVRPAVDLVAAAAYLPVDDASFDLVTAFHVLQYAGAGRMALDEIWRVLRPGGYCLLICPFLVAETGQPDRWRWTLQGLTSDLLAAGFVPVAQSRIGGRFLLLTALAAQAVSLSGVGWVGSARDRDGIAGYLRLGWNLLATLPFHLLGRLAALLDVLSPESRFYIGSVILVRRHDAR